MRTRSPGDGDDGFFPVATLFSLAVVVFSLLPMSGSLAMPRQEGPRMGAGCWMLDAGCWIWTAHDAEDSGQNPE
jgi:hypothetical protein